MSVPVANSFRYFNPNGTSSPGVSFAYWTSHLFDPSTLTPTDTTFNMLTADGKNAPAPWLPYTRADCNFGAVATANTILDNTAVDVPTVFGAGSPEEAEVVEIRDGVVQFEPLCRGISYRHATAREIVGHWRKTGRRGPGLGDEPDAAEPPAVPRSQLSLGIHT